MLGTAVTRIPILFIHDVGAGGLSNALPELVHDAGRGGRFELRAVPNEDPGMSPMEIWCNESQERYVMAIDVSRWMSFGLFVNGSAALTRLWERPRKRKACYWVTPISITRPSRCRCRCSSANRRACCEMSAIDNSEKPSLDIDRIDLEEAALRVLTTADGGGQNLSDHHW